MELDLWVALLLLGLALLYGVQRNCGRWSKLHLPPGPPGAPVLGNLSVFIGSKLPHHAVTDLVKLYGPLMFLRLGSTPCLVASSPEVLKELLKTQDHMFASRPASTPAQLVMYGSNSLGFAPFGDRWRQLRKISIVELFSQRRIDEFRAFREAEVSVMVRAIHHDAQHGIGTPINLRVMLKALAFNFTTQICFSKRYFEYEGQAPTAGVVQEINPQEAKEFTLMLEQASGFLLVQLIGDAIPYLSFLDRFTNVKSKMVKCGQRIDEFLTRILMDHKAHPKQTRPDFMDVLLGLPGLDGSPNLDDTTIKAMCLDMLGAGTDTSSITLEWTMTELLRHPEVALKLQAELDEVVGKERLVKEADIPNLPFLRAVVKEGLRLHPPAAFNVPHLSVQQTKVMGYDIPKSTVVFCNVWAMQRDPAVWANPMEFRPERFLEEPEIDLKGQHYQLLPFGSGRRGCPGLALGLISVQYTLATLVQAFNWSLPKGMTPQELDVEEAWGLTLPRANALEAVATARLPLLHFP